MVEAGRSRYYKPELDLLRFGAFLLVFLSHVVPGDVAFYAQMHISQPIAFFVRTDFKAEMQALHAEFRTVRAELETEIQTVNWSDGFF